jgi:hypothetical protein
VRAHSPHRPRSIPGAFTRGEEICRNYKGKFGIGARDDAFANRTARRNEQASTESRNCIWIALESSIRQPA